MTCPTLSFTVYGLPAPQGSKRHVGGGIMVESSKKVAPWREDVKLAALRALEACPDWDRVAPLVRLQVTFYLPRPRSHFRTGKFSDDLRDTAPIFAGKKPDLDKLLRSTGDALTTAGAYSDDSRVVTIWASKVYTRSGWLLDLAPMDYPGAVIALSVIEMAS